jgi:hypothetical protein
LEAFEEPSQALQNSHGIHDDIALHKLRLTAYIELKKAGRDQRKRSGPSAARPAASAQKWKRPSEPKEVRCIEFGVAHSSSQRRFDPTGNTPPPKLPVIINDARWTSSPSGRYSFQGS